MEIRELKIGNCFYNNGIIKTVSGIQIWPEEIVYDFDGNMNLEFEPVHLNYDLLIMFGFKNYVESDRMALLLTINKYIDCYADNQDNYSTLYVSCSNDELDELRLCDNLKYAHQLQNLYFALTGEDLTL